MNRARKPAPTVRSRRDLRIARTIRTTIVILVGIAVPVLALAEADSRIERKAFVERFGPESNVSGSVLVGVALMGDRTSRTALEDIRAYLPDPDADVFESLCIQVMSQDGRYEGHAEFAVHGGGGFASLGLQGDHNEDLRAFERRSIAVRAEFKRSCKDPDAGLLVPVQMGDDAAPDESLTVFVNSMDGDVEARIVAEESIQPEWTPCVAPDRSTELAFDRVCTLPTLGHAGRRRALEVKVTGWAGDEVTLKRSIEMPKQ